MKITGRIIARIVGAIIIAGGIAGYSCISAQNFNNIVEIDNLAQLINEQYKQVESSEEFVEKQNKLQAEYLSRYESNQINVEEFIEKTKYLNSREFIDDFMVSSNNHIERNRLIEELTGEKYNYELEATGLFLGAVGMCFGGSIVGGSIIADSFISEEETERELTK